MAAGPKQSDAHGRLSQPHRLPLLITPSRLTAVIDQGEMVRFLANEHRQYRRWLMARGFRRWITNAAVSTYDRVLDSFLEEVRRQPRPDPRPTPPRTLGSDSTSNPVRIPVPNPNPTLGPQEQRGHGDHEPLPALQARARTAQLGARIPPLDAVHGAWTFQGALLGEPGRNSGLVARFFQRNGGSIGSDMHASPPPP